MGEVFLKLLNLSIAAGWIVLALVILRVILRKMPRWIVCWMWAAVGIRLATPFAFESEVTLLPSTKIIDDPESSVRLVIQTAFENFDVSANDLLEGGIYGAAVSPDLFGKIMQVCAVVWVIGMLVMSLYTVISYVRLSRKVRISIRMQDNIYFCDEIDSPFVVGVFRPRIYLPSGMDEKQMFSVIRHEEAHIKRLDPLWKIIGFSLLTVYWFCPLMWLAYMLFSRDIEQACDEKAVSSLNFGGKQEYSRALLYCGARRRVFTAAPVAFGEVGVEERVRSVLFYENPDVCKTVTMLILCSMLFVSLLSTPVDDTAERISQSLNMSHAACNHVETYEAFAVYDALIMGEGECNDACWADFHVHEYGMMFEITECKDCDEIIRQNKLYNGYRCNFYRWVGQDQYEGGKIIKTD